MCPRLATARRLSIDIELTLASAGTENTNSAVGLPDRAESLIATTTMLQINHTY